MATELARQVSHIRHQHVLAQATHRGRASLFLSFSEAGVDIGEVYEAAHSGLMTLNQYDGRLGEFASNLLHPSSVSLQRELKSKEENKQLDKEIASLLGLLSLFASEPAMHQVLEYLIQRFRSHELNADALLRCMLPVHDTKIFARLVMLTPIKGSIWAFLEGVKQSGVPLPRSVLVKNLQKDVGVLQALCRVTQSAIKLASANGVRARSAAANGAEKTLSFFTATIIEMTETHSLDDPQLRLLYPLLLEGLRAPSKVTASGHDERSSSLVISVQFMRSCCMIIANMSRRTQFGTPLMKSLVAAIVHAFANTAKEDRIDRRKESLELTMTLAILAQQQRIVFEPAVLSTLFRNHRNGDDGVGGGGGEEEEEEQEEKEEEEEAEEEESQSYSSYFLETLQTLGQECDVTDLVHSAVFGLTTSLLYSNSSSSGSSSSSSSSIESSSSSKSISPSLARRLLCNMISSSTVSEHALKMSTKKILEHGKAARQTRGSKAEDAVYRAAYGVLRCVAQRFPQQFDDCVDETLQEIRAAEDIFSPFDVEATSAERRSKRESPTESSLRTFLSSAFSDALYHVPGADGTSLLLSLCNTSPQVRIQALETFSQTVQQGISEHSPSIIGLAEAACNCLQDKEAAVAKAAWSTPVISLIAEYVRPSVLLEASTGAVAWWVEKSMRVPKRSCDVLSAVFECLALPIVANSLAQAGKSAYKGSETSLSGREWLFCTTFSCALSLVRYLAPHVEAAAKQEDAKEKDKVEKNLKTLELAAMRCAAALGNSNILPLFKGLEVEQRGGPESHQAALAKSIATGMCLDPQASLEVLRPVTEHALYMLSRGSGVADKRTAQAFMRLMDATAVNLSLAVSVQRTREAATSAMLLYAKLMNQLLLHAIYCAEGNSDECKNSLKIAVELFTRYFQFCKCLTHLVHTSYQNVSSVTSLAHTIARPIDARQVGVRLLLSFLSSPHPSVAALAGDCINAFFSQDPHVVLMHVALAPVSQNALSTNALAVLAFDFDHGEADAMEEEDEVSVGVSRTCLNIPFASRAGALYALATYVETISASSTASRASLSHSAALIMAAFLSVTACCSRDVLVRQGGLAVASKLSSLAKTLTLTCSAEDTKSLCNALQSSGELVLAGKTLQSISSTIATDSSASHAAIGLKLFSSSSQQSDSASLSLQKMLLWIASLTSWGAPTASASIVSASMGASLDVSWKYLETICDDAMAPSTVLLQVLRVSDYQSINSLSHALMQCMSTVKLAKAAAQEHVTNWMRKCILSEPTNAASESLRNATFSALGHGWADALSSQQQRNLLFADLIVEQIRHPGRESTVAAIHTVRADFGTVVSVLKTGGTEFIAAHKAVFESNKQNIMDLDEPDDEFRSLSISGMSMPLQRLCSLIEAVSDLIQSATPTAELSLVASIILDLFAIVNDRRLKAILSVEYTISLLAEMAQSCILRAGPGLLSEVSGSVRGSRQRQRARSGSLDSTTSTSSVNGAANSSEFGAAAYSRKRVTSDVKQVLQCLGTVRSMRVQSSVLKLLQALVSIDPSTSSQSVSVLGQLLSSTSLGQRLFREGNNSSGVGANTDGILIEVLKTFSNVMISRSITLQSTETDEDGTYLPQEILQPLCAYFGEMPAHRRSTLLNLALASLHDTALPACVNILLVHAFCTFEMDIDQSAKAAAAAAEGGANDGAVILLSRAAQRKAFRSLKTSQPEELFRLAVDITNSRGAEAQVFNLVAIAKTAHAFLEMAFVKSKFQPEIVSVEIGDEINPMTVDTSKLQEYLESILQRQTGSTASATTASDAAVKAGGGIKGTPGKVSAAATAAAAASANENRGSAAAMVLLNLEFLYETMENKQFHRSLVPLIDGVNVAAKIQEQFVELSEQLLQLLALATQIQQVTTPDMSANKKKKSLTIRLCGEIAHLSAQAFGKSIWMWCLDILKSLQRLLDAPTFVSILQELIDHEQPGVRKAALQILGQRLQHMSTNKRTNSEERMLFLDLTIHLRKSIQDSMPSPTSASSIGGGGSGRARGESDGLSREDRIGLAQSALMCLDTLARHVGRGREWVASLSDALSELLALSSILVNIVQPAMGETKLGPIELAGEIKLLASTLLCCGTLVKVVGAKAFTLLPQLMSNLLGSMEHQARHVLLDDQEGQGADEMDQEREDEDEEDENVGDGRGGNKFLTSARVLLLRSSMTAVASIVGEIPTFSHPYLQRAIATAIALHNLGNSSEIVERRALASDADQTMSVFASRIPPRLSLPFFIQSAPTLLATDHVSASRFALFLSESWNGLDRPTVLANLNDLSTLAALILDYRRAYGDDSKESDEAQAEIISAVIVMCLKLTESELKTFLAKLGEWRDSQLVTEGFVSRGVVFYQLLNSLASKLRSIFVPSIAPYWQHAVDTLKNFAQITKGASSSSEADEDEASRGGGGKKGTNGSGKKRKRASEPSSSAPVQVSNDEFKEDCAMAKAVLKTLWTVCTHDDGNFIDEPRYSSMMPVATNLLAARFPFGHDGDERFLEFASDFVTPCLTALALCVNKDTLWKPLMHRVLMLTRSVSSAVRIAALKTIHKLFTEVGEDFLLLLPECLPFLSELLEDDVLEVANLTGTVIRYIEELSGEKLESYI